MLMFSISTHQAWLDYVNVEYKEALNLLTRIKPEVTWHPVSTQVNKSQNQEMDLNHPVEVEKYVILFFYLKCGKVKF